MKSLFSFRRPGRRPSDRRRRTVHPELQTLEGRALLSGYRQVNLVGYQPGMARHTDPLLNGWGLDFAPDGPFCVADTSTGVATFYDHQGNTASHPVTIPPAAFNPPGIPGSPTGVVYNPTSDFVISENGRSAPARFIFDTLDGLICGWNPQVDPNRAIVMVDNSTESPYPASYTGLALARTGHGQAVLYAADSGTGPTTSNNRIDMFDGAFRSVGSFTDPNVASQYPGNTVFQVEDVNNKLYVTFTGFTVPFGGVVDVFDTDGHLLTPNHFAANAPGQGPLIAPWGMAQAPSHFGKYSGDVLIGNVDGPVINNVEQPANINVFDPATGAFLGLLTHVDGTPIAIPGLWDLAFGAGNKNNGKTDELFFTAGFTAADPAGNGLFGMIDAAGDQGGNSQADHAIPAAVNPGTVAVASGVSALSAPHREIGGSADLAPLRTTASPWVSAAGSRASRSLPNQASPASARPTWSLVSSGDGTGPRIPSAATHAGRDAVLAGVPRDPLNERSLDGLAQALTS